MRRLVPSALCLLARSCAAVPLLLQVLCGACIDPRDMETLDAGRPDASTAADLAYVFDPGCHGDPCSDQGQCPEGQRCVGQVCLPDRGACTEGMEPQCADDSRCYLGACVRFDACDKLAPYDPDCREANFPSGSFPPPRIFCQYSKVNSFSTPLVADLDRDGKPEIVTVGFPNRIVAIHGDTCEPLWDKTLPLLADGQGSLAVADLDGDGEAEIVGIDAAARVFVLDARGELLATSPTPLQERNPYFWEVWSSPSIADVDGIAPPEIIAGAQVSRFHRGPPARIEVLWTHENRTAFWGSLSVAADLDGDGAAEVITSDRIYDGPSGMDKTPGGLSEKPFYPQVADFNHDKNPDLLLIQSQENNQIVSIYDYRAQRTLFGPYQLGAGAWGGPAVIADLDGDGELDFGLAGGRFYFAYALKCGLSPAAPGCRGSSPGLLWEKPITDTHSGSAGSTAFDFNGDGAAELVYRDECWLRVLRGHDGKTLFAYTITSSTGLEVPVIADVNGDGHADIVVTSDADTDFLAVCTNGGHPEPETHAPWSGWSRGIFVLSDPLQKWLPARPLWNQHAYHISHINDDLRVPAAPPPSWLTHNTYRQNLTLGAAAPRLQIDLTARLLPTQLPRDCALPWPLLGEVCNRGTAPALPPVSATFYDGPPDGGGVPVCTAATRAPLAAGSCQVVGCLWSPPPTRKTDLYLRAGDDGQGMRQPGQCNRGNDVSAPQSLSCFNTPP
mgnify:CR=1 FL=1